MSRRKDEAAAKKAADLMNIHNKVTERLDKTGKTEAADNIRNHGGRWDSPEARRDANGGRGRTD